MLQKTNQTKLIVLIDPDKFNSYVIELANKCKVYCFFVGGSKLKKNNLEQTIQSIKSISKIPVIIFPGDESQISKLADGLLILSLLSGRNPDYLIGKHVKVASKIKKSKIKTIPTGYILINGNSISTTQKITKTQPLISKKEVIETAIAGELLGKQLIYLESGSGAKSSLTPTVIKTVLQNISIPLIVGGGINTLSKVKKTLLANPDYMVIGNAIEENPLFLTYLNKLL